MNKLLQLALLPVAIGVWAGFAVLREVAAITMAPDARDVWEDEVIA